MDLSVRFQMADRAIELYQILQSRQEKDQRLLASDNERSHDGNQAENDDKQLFYSHNASIQVGILIKAYGQLKNLDMAFKIFEDHQQKMVLISRQNKIKDPSSSPLTDCENDMSCRDSMSRGCDEYELDQWHQSTQPYNNDITFGCLIDACVKNG